jgi:hypothetical protein
VNPKTDKRVRMIIRGGRIAVPAVLENGCPACNVRNPTRWCRRCIWSGGAFHGHRQNDKPLIFLVCKISFEQAVKKLLGNFFIVRDFFVELEVRVDEIVEHVLGHLFEFGEAGAA